MTETSQPQPGPPARTPFVISRTFPVPRDRLWNAWTDPEQLKQWFGPSGCAMEIARMNFRPGGLFHYCLKTPDGHRMWGRFVYREILAPEWILLVNSFSDEEGGITRHPLSPSWPLEMLSSFALTEQAGATAITVQWFPLNATEAEQKTFDAGHASMTQGWTGTFDQLERYLARA